MHHLRDVCPINQFKLASSVDCGNHDFIVAPPSAQIRQHYGVHNSCKNTYGVKMVQPTKVELYLKISVWIDHR